MNAAPEHPGNPTWQTFSEWKKLKTPKDIRLIKSEKETLQEQFERFNLVDEGGAGWGDASEAQDAGWGLGNQDNAEAEGGW
ncbi:hypothetical protein G6F57_009826 [Rhizopus arrhizus]|jgi:hypothetical protein|uniref:Uncharacterized protein n=1 Tax=Rhizopus oryzae TaxID=64495 RepID=A0A9P7BS02_RHIOR|nr:hypothetical protein G6F23_005791 [Rhizopus arrhizus]KAG1427453.1 hypothetical protein G6F58_001028 [Rhizopus delemar]KAG0758511.1 hypothetical protein G6F24_009749 [Rhizopus arrhizus]KAG0783937.1 hypothetical protein G6F22_008497 [Rhizopus arrhizus]KAG0791199.1 hypothetical protein G6F21_005256 [Rhizopus arrhizus]